MQVFSSLHTPVITQLTGRSRRHDGASRYQHRNPVTVSADQFCLEEIAAHLSTCHCFPVAGLDEGRAHAVLYALRQAAMDVQVQTSEQIVQIIVANYLVIS